MLNKTMIQGRLVADPELRTTNTGISVCSFRVAWSERYKENERKLFLNCTAWRGLGEMISRNFTKGKEIVVEGALESREYEAKDGTKRTAIELNVDKVHFCGAKTAPAEQPAQEAPAATFTEATDDGDLPF